MNRHPTDLVALLFGLAFCVAGGTFVAHELADRSFDPAWVVAIGLVTLGVVALVATIVRPRPDSEPDGPAEGAEPTPTPETAPASEPQAASREYS